MKDEDKKIMEKNLKAQLDENQDIMDLFDEVIAEFEDRSEARITYIAARTPLGRNVSISI